MNEEDKKHIIAGVDLKGFTFGTSAHIDYEDSFEWVHTCEALGISRQSIGYRDKKKKGTLSFYITGKEKTYPTLETLIMENRAEIKARIAEYIAKNEREYAEAVKKASK